MYDEHVVPWESAAVTDTNTITFTVKTGSSRCFGVRTVAQEEGDTLKVAIIQGDLEKKEDCDSVSERRKVAVRTKASARDLKVVALKADEVDLNS